MDVNEKVHPCIDCQVVLYSVMFKQFLVNI